MPLSKIPAVGVDATGTPDSTTFFRGDNTWSAPVAAALSTASGSAPSYSARAWVNFNGTGTVAIRSSGNVTSITDNGVGNYTVNLTTAMPDANYTTVASGSYNDNAINAAQEPWVKVASVTTSTIRIYTHWHVFNVGYTAQDIAYVGLAVLR
jgi:hypothetical protein